MNQLGFRRSAGADLKVFADDVFLVSYPRSGNTWMRFLLGSLLHGTDVDFTNMEKLVPDIYRCTHGHLESRPRPRYLKSHEPYDGRYPKVIYLVRDPRDVAISYHRWQLKFRRTTDSLDAFVKRFVDEGFKYGTWGDHVTSWLEGPGAPPPRLVTVRYEDLVADTVLEVSRVVKFLGLDVTDRTVATVVEANRLERMRKKEREASDTDLFRNTREDVAFIGEGTTGAWTGVLGSGADRIAQAFRGAMLRVGYPVD